MKFLEIQRIMAPSFKVVVDDDVYEWAKDIVWIYSKRGYIEIKGLGRRLDLMILKLEDQRGVRVTRKEFDNDYRKENLVVH